VVRNGEDRELKLNGSTRKSGSSRHGNPKAIYEGPESDFRVVHTQYIENDIPRLGVRTCVLTPRAFAIALAAREGLTVRVLFDPDRREDSEGEDAIPLLITTDE
jgi:hypothetical protein